MSVDEYATVLKHGTTLDAFGDEGKDRIDELLREGQRVEFTPEESQKGPRAGDIRLVE